ncbi:GNAT family N-acetyltransferase [Nonlabens ulvanivorans]|uniref:GNAT family N-acetyltransferase n=1 Tax=Nonlabens ulvanivorans TaxID=906888 RepID=UPI0037C6D884
MTLRFETDRLILRPFEESDAPYLFELNDDEEVMRYTGDIPFKDVEDARKFAIDYSNNPQGQIRKYHMGRLAVIRKEDDVFIGWTGLKYHVDGDFVDTGYRFMKKYWGKGYATESTRRVLQHAFEDHHLKVVEAHIHEHNYGSQKVAQRLKMKLDHRFLWSGVKPARCYKITNDEFRNS